MPSLKTIPLTGAALEKYYAEQAQQHDEEQRDYYDVSSPPQYSLESHASAESINNRGTTESDAFDNSVIQQDPLFPSFTSGYGSCDEEDNASKEGNFLCDSREFSEVLSRTYIPEEQGHEEQGHEAQGHEEQGHVAVSLRGDRSKSNQTNNSIFQQWGTVPSTNEEGSISTATKAMIAITREKSCLSKIRTKYMQCRDYSLTEDQQEWRKTMQLSPFIRNVPLYMSQPHHRCIQDNNTGTNGSNILFSSSLDETLGSSFLEHGRNASTRIEGPPFSKIGEHVSSVSNVQVKSKDKKRKCCSITFDTRVEELKAYKATRGHCNVRKSEDSSLAQWVTKIRLSRRQIENNDKPNRVLTEDDIKRLTGMGFSWNPAAMHSKINHRIEELKAYKAKNGHCNVRKCEDSSLAQWCTKMRSSRKQIENNDKPIRVLTEDDIKRLTAMGFSWHGFAIHPTIDDRIKELKAYKAKHGHYNVRKCEDSSLAQWCTKMRSARKQIANNEKPRRKLSEDTIKRLTEMGFNWEFIAARVTINDRIEELKAYKAAHGHCNVHKSEYHSLAQWCTKIRLAKRQIENNKKPNRKLTKTNIKRLTEMGFNWDYYSMYFPEIR